MSHPRPTLRHVLSLPRRTALCAAFLVVLATACAHTSIPATTPPPASPGESPRALLDAEAPLRPVGAPAMRHYLRAQMLSLDGDWPAAADAMRLAVSHDPESAFLRVELARLLNAQKRLDAALRELHRAVELEPDYPRAHYHLGEIAYMQHDFDRAAGHFVRVLALDPQHPEAIRALGGVLFITEGVEATIRFLEERLAVDPSLVETRATLVRLYLLRGETAPMTARILEGIRMDTRAAELAEDVADWCIRTGRIHQGLNVFDDLIQAAGDLPILRLRQADLLMAAGKDDEADAAMAAAQAGKHFDDDATIRLGMILLRHGRYERADALLDDLVAANGPMTAVYLLGYVRMEAGDCPRARLQFDRLSPPDGSAYASARVDTARCLRDAGDARGADAVVEALLSRSEGDMEAVRLVADYHLDNGEEDRAIAMLEGQMKAHPVSVDLAHLAAAYMLLAGRSARAVEILTRLAEADPYNPDILNLLAYGLAMRGERLPEAEQLARQAMSLRPGDGAIIDTLGYTAYRRGDLETALRWLGLAELLLPNEPEVLLHLALVYRDLGNRTALRRVLRDAFRATEDDPAARARFEAQFPAPWRALQRESNPTEGGKP